MRRTFCVMGRKQGMRLANWSQSGFTLVELLVSMTILAILLMIVSGVISQSQKQWSRASARVSQFREARLAFDHIVRNVSQATLNTYWDYQRSDPSNPLEVPSRYSRKSDLQFLVGPASQLLAGVAGASASALPGHAVLFQAPLGVVQSPTNEGLSFLLCGRGYFVHYGDDSVFLPAFLQGDNRANYARVRFRLMEYAPPAERNRIYSTQYKPGAASKWYDDALTSLSPASENSAATRSSCRPVAENIVALVVTPMVSNEEADSEGRSQEWIAPNYEYDSTKEWQTGQSPNASRPQGVQHMLPPLLRITMVAIDEPSALKLELANTGGNLIPGNLFSNTGQYDADLKTLAAKLIEEKLSYRVFSTTVALRGAKWSL